MKRLLPEQTSDLVSRLPPAPWAVVGLALGVALVIYGLYYWAMGDPAREAYRRGFRRGYEVGHRDGDAEHDFDRCPKCGGDVEESKGPAP